MNGGAFLSVAPALALRPVKLKEQSTGSYVFAKTCGAGKDAFRPFQKFAP